MTRHESLGLRLAVDPAAGNVRVELQDEAGAPLSGYALADCDVVHTANEISRAVRWKGKIGRAHV